jgi:hypothetical protein
MPSLELFCEIEGDLALNVIGQSPAGMRIDFPFSGVATSPHWEGKRPVQGVDYVTVRSDGNMVLDIHGVIGEKREKVAYSATGVSIANSDNTANPKELIVFDTGNENLAWLNDEVAVAFGTAGNGKLSLAVHLIRP